MTIKEKARLLEEKMAFLFSIQKPFSEHLMKWEDSLLPDKYDHNCFEYRGQPSRTEFEAALAYQKGIGATFIKLEGNEPLRDTFGLEAGVTFTMAFSKKEAQWRIKEGLSLRKPALSDLESLDLRHFGEIYGEDFVRRNIRRLYEKLDYHGAYLGDILVGACYSFSTDGITCIDNLIVDHAYRHQYAATTIIENVKKMNPADILILHADSEDTPKDMYLKMGFEIVDKLYEYSLTGI